MSTPPEYFWKLRAYPDCRFASVWLCVRTGAGEECLLFGELIPQLAEQVIAALNLPVEREKSPLTGLDPIMRPECVSVATQRDLFDE